MEECVEQWNFIKPLRANPEMKSSRMKKGKVFYDPRRKFMNRIGTDKERWVFFGSTKFSFRPQFPLLIPINGYHDVVPPKDMNSVFFLYASSDDVKYE